MSEAKVVRDLKRHLLVGGLDGVVPGRILVDADPSYVNSQYARELEPMARVDVGGGRPDLLCSADRNEGALVTGFEVKAEAGDWLKGLSQARRYRAGVHHSYLALPGKHADIERNASAIAREVGVGILVFENNTCNRLLKPADPMPLPWTLGPTASALEGVPLARQLQLNHPLNYLVVPYLAATLRSGHSLFEELESRWPDLGSAATRRHAIVGAATLHLIDMNSEPTAEGIAVADLLLGLGFTPEKRPSKRARLVDVEPAVAAVARFVFLQQPAVRLLMKSLAALGFAVSVSQLAVTAFTFDPPLAGALFLADPSSEVHPEMPGESYNPSTVFKLKQNLWHAGFLTRGRHSSAGGQAVDFRPQEDVWELEPRRTFSE